MQNPFPDHTSYRQLIDLLSAKLKEGTIVEDDDFTELVMELLYLERQGNLAIAEESAARFEQI